MRKGMKMEIEEVEETANKNLGGEKEKNENKKQIYSIVRNSNRVVFGVLYGYTCDCR